MPKCFTLFEEKINFIKGSISGKVVTRTIWSNLIYDPIYHGDPTNKCEKGNSTEASSGHITLVFFPKLAPTETQTVPIVF